MWVLRSGDDETIKGVIFKYSQIRNGEEGLGYINSLFKIERDLTELPDDERLEKRKELSKQIYEDFLAWVEKTSGKIITNEKLKEALTYVKN